MKQQLNRRRFRAVAGTTQRARPESAGKTTGILGAAAVLVLSAGAADSAALQLLQNGSLTGPLAMSQLPPEWEQYRNNSSDTADATGPFGTYVLSPDGGTFVRSFTWDARSSSYNYSQREGLKQQVSGLLPGDSYSLSFFQSSLNGINSITHLPFSGATGYWSLEIDGILVAASDPMAPPPGTSLDNQWRLENLSFVATAETHEIALLATVPDSSPPDTQTFLGIDGIQLAMVPEPSTGILGIIGMFGFGMRRRRSVR